MSFFDSLIVAFFMLSVVFVVLAVLYALISMVSAVLRLRRGEKATAVQAEGLPANTESDEDYSVVYASTGEVKLKNVDEKTAALIMAIVSHESGIPLSELQFKSIRAID